MTSERRANLRDSVMTSIERLLDEIDGENGPDSRYGGEYDADALPPLALTIVLLTEALENLQ